jgi:hypothetical protein
VVRTGFLSAIDDIGKHLQWVKIDLEQWLPMLRREAWGTSEARKEKLGAAQSAVARMGFKLKERPDAPKTFAAQEVRRKVQPAPTAPPPGSAAPYKPEPTLIDTDYEHILSLISSMATVLERSPHAFAKMDEESLRFLLLVPLNSHYEGQVTGETFNFEGKTDILIRVQGKTMARHQGGDHHLQPQQGLLLRGPADQADHGEPPQVQAVREAGQRDGVPLRVQAAR